MDYEMKALLIAERLPIGNWEVDVATKAIAAALREAANEALERAANEVESHHFEMHGPGVVNLNALGDRIRNLKDRPR